VVESKEDVVTEVSRRTWAIGVTGMPEAIPALDRVQLVRLVDEGHTEVSTYALSRPLFFFTVEDSARVRQFLEFVTDKKAQEIIQDTGFYPAHQVDAISKEE
jgi:ABC-type phosphate transport system substrate-binding protein